MGCCQSQHTIQLHDCDGRTIKFTVVENELSMEIENVNAIQVQELRYVVERGRDRFRLVDHDVHLPISALRKLQSHLRRDKFQISEVFTPVNNRELRDAATKWIAGEWKGEHISKWDTSNVTDMGALFREIPDVETFNDDLITWNVSNVTEMSFMFYCARAFNHDLNAWDVSKVVDMSSMFEGATAFNGDVAAWNVSRVTTLDGAFSKAMAFNGDLSAWDVSHVTSMQGLFTNAESFNGDLRAWNVSSCREMYRVFAGAVSFNCDLYAWDTSNVEDMEQMFENARAFNEAAAPYGGDPNDARKNIAARAKVNAEVLTIGTEIVDSTSVKLEFANLGGEILLEIHRNLSDTLGDVLSAVREQLQGKLFTVFLSDGTDIGKFSDKCLSEALGINNNAMSKPEANV